jgi:AraC-like DNA-binding protein
MKIYIKNMVCTRCKIIVKEALEKFDIKYKSLDLGEVETIQNITQEKLKMLDNYLRLSELEIIESKKSILAEKIKAAIEELVRNTDEELKVNLSDYLYQKLNLNYSFLSIVFSSVESISIEQFYINLKIDYVKELLVNNELNLKEISFMARYSSVAHLSNQFKKKTGMAPSQFRHFQHRDFHSSEHVGSAADF